MTHYSRSELVRGSILAMLIFTVAVTWYAVAREARDVLTVAFLDVGQGDAIYIEAPNGNQILIDGGSGAQVIRELGSVMPFYDRSLDVVIATHPDKDHIGGLHDVLQRFSVDYVLEPGVESGTNTYQAFEKAVLDEHAQHILARRGMDVVLSRDVRLHILFPDRDVAGFETNTASIVVQLIYGDIEFLLTGDSPRSVERYLVSIDGTGLASDVLKPGHHGSKTSSSQEFLAAVHSMYAVISAGKDNHYGHPHKEVIDRLNAMDMQVGRTYEEGTIVFESDGREVRKK